MRKAPASEKPAKDASPAGTFPRPGSAQDRGAAPAPKAPPLPGHGGSRRLRAGRGRAGAVAETPAAPAGDPANFVRAYYRALDEKRFEAAWESLGPAIQKRLGSFAKWKAGYGKTVSSKPRDFAVSAAGATIVVKHVLVARDRGCGAREFAVTWRLRETPDGFSVVGLTGVARAGSRREYRPNVDQIDTCARLTPVVDCRDRASCVAPGTRDRPWTVFPPALSGATQGVRAVARMT